VKIISTILSRSAADAVVMDVQREEAEKNEQLEHQRSLEAEKKQALQYEVTNDVAAEVLAEVSSKKHL
jgi:hypothetical protein